jgi:hypothetical protein
VNQHATIREVVFSVEVTPRLYKEDLRQLIDRTEFSSGVDSCRELRESPKLAVGRIIEKKW